MKRGLSTHAESAPPPKKRKLSQVESTCTESSLSPEEPAHGRFKPGQIVYEDDDFQFEFLYNDQEENHLIALCDLKQIFAACLPRMGTRYVTRHVFDEHHRLICCRSKAKGNSNAHLSSSNSNSNQNNPNTIQSNINYPVLYPVIGGICIRPFYEQHFGEVVFLAVHNQHQHKSVGRKIMRVMKHVAIKENLHHFYTYADNQAIGFFQKMGFVKKKTSAHLHHPNKHQFVSNSNSNSHKKELFWDYIKHYTGSELMECKLHCKVDYIHLDDNLRSIEKDILFQCENYRKAQFGNDYDKEYSPPPSFLIPINKLIVILDLEDSFETEQEDDLLMETLNKYGIENDRHLYDVYKTSRLHNKRVNLKEILKDTFGMKRGDEIYSKFVTYLSAPNDTLVLNHIDVLEHIEGVKEEWENTSQDSHKWRDDVNKRRSSRFFPVRMKATWILKRLIKNDDAYPFALPVSRDVEGYYERIKHPMDLQTMTEKNDRGKYAEWKQFDHDFKLMIANCKEFNEPGSDIVRMCIRLNEYYMQCSIKYDRTINN